MFDDAREVTITNKQQFKPNWFGKIVKKLKRYKEEIFGSFRSQPPIEDKVMLDYGVKPSYKFVFAKHTDGCFRPASISGRCKKRQLFVVTFYCDKRCLYIRPCDVLFRHGNLLNFKVSFRQHGRCFKGKVFGNNSPANKGLPSVFYVKKKEKWFKVPVKNVFLTKKQFNKFKFDGTPAKNHKMC